eukprot:1155993-Pelagomonas_calceolata.AAC.1
MQLLHEGLQKAPLMIDDVALTDRAEWATAEMGLCSSKEEIAKSPFVEQLLRKDYEVIYFTDVLDEYVMQVCGWGGVGWIRYKYSTLACVCGLGKRKRGLAALACDVECMCFLACPCAVQHVPDYEDKAFANASKEDLKMADKDEQEKKKDKVRGLQSEIDCALIHVSARSMLLHAAAWNQSHSPGLCVTVAVYVCSHNDSLDPCDSAVQPPAWP